MNRLTRRLLGGLFLFTAIVMLVLGETRLRGRLGPAATLLYWSVCLLATGAAIMCALVDALRSLRQSRHERSALLDDTLQDIETERARRPIRPRNPVEINCDGD